MGRYIDMTGQTTENNIYIIEKAPKQGNETHWRCVCPKCKRDDWIVKGSRLRGKNQATVCKKCSCLNNLQKIKEPYFKDITGQRFGFLVALEKTSNKNGSTYIWKCQCDCGNICYIDGEYLRNGDTQSCGCNSSSRGENKIKEILLNNNIDFSTEVSFDNFTYLDTKRKPRFDFMIKNKDSFYLIEYDGRQHFTETFYSQNLIKIKNNDKIKNEWCIKNKIPLIRIPYTHLNKLNLQDLLLETSKFIVQEEKDGY